MSDRGWDVRALGDIATFEYGSSLPAAARIGDEFPVFGSNGEVGRHRTELVKGPGIIVGRKGTVGALVWSDCDFWPIDTTYYVGVRPYIDMRWLYWALSTLGLDRLDSSTGVPGLNRNDAYGLTLKVPPHEEQRRIAKILDALDNQIQLSEQIITKLAAVQRGIIVDLLTNGIDKNGNMRAFGRRPGQFCDSSIGPVPVDWVVAPLATYQHPRRPYLKTGPFGSSLKQEHWVDEGVPVVTIGSLGDGVFIDSELLYIAEKTASMLSSYALSPGDIVFSRVADVGRSVVIGQREEGWIMSSNMMWIAIDPSRADPRFIRANIAANPNVRRQIRRYVNSAGRDVANAKIMNLLQFPWPPLEEQIAIADKIAASELRIAAEQSRAAKLRASKDGLAADLLTGRVRIPMGIA
ncbi:restriction endonuclease subunit S [Mycolicibacterium peregrinum]|uniref:restriction endonuclease subunit S n=1 Tax=Mycolicibacterium peregrinum TaxID=43304 RepID=UPI003AAE78EC